MSFGMSIRALTELLIDSNFAIPFFIDKVTPAYAGSPTPTIDEYSFNFPASPSSGRLVFWTLPAAPANCYYNFLDPFTASNQAIDYNPRAHAPSILVFRPSGVSAGSVPVPTGYVFGLFGIPPSGAAFGYQVFKADTTIAYDSNHRHLQLSAGASMTFPPSGNTTTAQSSSLPALPAAPAFFIAPWGSEVWTQRSDQSASDAVYQIGGVRRDGGALVTKNAIVGSGYEDAPVRGSLFIGYSPAFVPVIDTALYP